MRPLRLVSRNRTRWRQNSVFLSIHSLNFFP
jgi:hypothetical protein